MSSSRLPIPNRVKGGPSASSQITRKTICTPQPAAGIIVIDADDDGAPAVHAKDHEGSLDVEVVETDAQQTHDASSSGGKKAKTRQLGCRIPHGPPGRISPLLL